MLLRVLGGAGGSVGGPQTEEPRQHATKNAVRRRDTCSDRQCRDQFGKLEEEEREERVDSRGVCVPVREENKITNINRIRVENFLLGVDVDEQVTHCT